MRLCQNIRSSLDYIRWVYTVYFTLSIWINELQGYSIVGDKQGCLYLIDLVLGDQSEPFLLAKSTTPVVSIFESGGVVYAVYRSGEIVCYIY